MTVAILAFNRRDALGTTLAKVRDELEYPPETLELIVVDNASSDGTAEMVATEFPSVRVIRLAANVGVSGWNSAFREGRGEWFLVLDDDCWIDGDALTLALGAAQAAHADLVSFSVRSEQDPEYFFTEEYTPGLFAFWGCACLISRRALERLGGYDPYIFVWGNELEFTIRLLDAGFRHLYLPDVVAVHMKVPGWTETAARRARRFNHRHWAYTAAKLLQPADAARVIVRQFGAIAVEAAAHSVRDLAAIPGVVGGMRSGIRHRAPVRPVVSVAYRDNFVSFASQIEVLVAPRERLARLLRGDRRALSREAPERWRRYRAARPDFYPHDEGSLIFPMSS